MGSMTVAPSFEGGGRQTSRKEYRTAQSRHCRGSVRIVYGAGWRVSRFQRKSWIRQVLISRTLTVCGEVAERLKAAVC